VRILAVTNHSLPSRQGGAEVALFNSCQGLREAGHEVRILSITAQGLAPLDRAHELGGLVVHEVALARRVNNRVLQTYDPAVAARVRTEIERFKPDIMHTHNLSGSSLAPIRVAGMLRLPVVATLHDLWLLCANNMLLRSDLSLCSPADPPCGRCFREYDYWAPVPRRRTVFRRLTGNVCTFVSPSQRLIDLHVEGGYERTRFALVRHGLHPLAQSPADGARTTARWKIGATTMLFVGAVVLSKGVGVLIEALPRLIQGIPRFRLLVAGRGAQHLEAELQAFGEHVVMLGAVPRTRIADVYPGVGLTVMPSTINENSPLSVCESLMAGTPVLGARIGGIPELIVEGETGYLYEPHDPRALADAAIQHFQRASRDIRAMRRASMAYGEREFSVTMHVERLVEIYQSALSGNGYSAV
jgi:glycosyltransferase involved in cell wall biosynthesis